MAEITSADSNAPVIGAIVYLELQDSGVVRSALSNDLGRVMFLGIPAGVYRLRAEMIGMATGESAFFELPTGLTVTRTLTLSSRPIELDGISIEAAQRCRLVSDDGHLTAQLWDEARKALTATAFTDQQEIYRYETLLYEHDLSRDTRIIERSRQSRRQASMRTPFRSRPASDLMENGFVEPSGGVDLYYAPDANVLLSDLFLNSHCFRLASRQSRDVPTDLVGLAFEPLGDRRVPDIEGTLWLDQGTAHLRFIEYRYVNLPDDITSDEVGGRVEFQAMPDGTWIVLRWWIRMPRVAVQSGLDGRRQRYIGGYREAGGIVLDVEGSESPRLSDVDETGGVEGLVLDSLGLPKPQVRVAVVGSNQQVFSNSSGRYGITGLVEGVYRIEFRDSVLESLGLSQEPVEQPVQAGQLVRLDYRVPALSTALADACASVPTIGPELEDLPPQAQGTGVLLGRVVDEATEDPLPGARVRVISFRNEFAPGGSRTTTAAGAGDPLRGYDVNLGGVDPNQTRVIVHQGMYGFETVADDSGFYRFCRVPERELLTVIGTLGTRTSDGDTLKVMEIGGFEEHTVRIPGLWF